VSCEFLVMSKKVSGEKMKTANGQATTSTHEGSQDRMRVSVIIPTKNRPEGLHATLESLLAQTRRPDEIVIVDQGSSPAIEASGFPIPITYIYDPQVSGAAVARNVAMDQATGDIWVFLDDDELPEPDYIKELLAAYTPDVAGVSGIITNYTLPPRARRIFETLFVSGPFHDDRQPVYWHADHFRARAPQRVKQFGCGVMSFRASAIKGLRFDPNLTGCSLAEDIDFCARLPRGSVLLIAPKARLFHKRSPAGRDTAHWLEAHAQSSSYMRMRNWNRGLGDDFSFAWLQVGYALMAVIGSLKRGGSLEPFRAWRKGAARGRSFGSPTPKLTALDAADGTFA
jgi:glycosyltransferase involved in cell wall biosynthesis